MPQDTLLAHTLAEAYLYFLATPCSSCGQGPVRKTGAAPDGGSDPDDGRRLQVRAKCDNCQAEVTQAFKLTVGPDRVDQAAPIVINPTDEPSGLLDVGQWITLYKMLLEAAAHEPDSIQARRLRIEASQCLDEALKFYTDPDNDLPPPEALFTPASQERIREYPQQFSRRRLIETRSKLPTETHTSPLSNQPTSAKDSETQARSRRWIGLVLAPILAAVVYWLVPAEVMNEAGEVVGGLSGTGRAVTAVGTLMAVLWISEALPIAVTALLPIALFPLLTGGGITVKDATAPYAHELIYLFMGGFLLALAMQEWDLHRRIALHTILLVGTHPVRLIGGFMLASAFLSMWVSNTATVVMMLPIAMSVVELVRRELDRAGDPNSPHVGRPFHFAICLMLGTAYASSIGGIGTLIGTPPNAMLAAFLSREYDIEISFIRWMAVGIPLVVVFLPIAWWMLTRVIYPVRLKRIPGGRDLIRRELESQGPMSGPERAVLVVFALTAAAWMTRPLLAELRVAGEWQPLAGLTDAGIAIGAAILLFAIPVDLARGVFLLSWRQAAKLPWGVLILFGGGLSLATAVKTEGVADYIAHGVSGFHALPLPVLLLIVVAMIVFLTELTSNTATTATFLPILAAVAVGLGVSPMLLVVPMAIAASCAFMMPVATPPNAIVFSSGELTIPQMCKAGLWLNVIGIALIMGLAYAIIIPVLGIQLP